MRGSAPLCVPLRWEPVLAEMPSKAGGEGPSSWLLPRCSCCSGIGNTSVEPALPACATQLLHPWKLVEADGQLVRPRAAPAAGGPAVGAYVAAAAVLVGALAAAGWVVWRRQRVLKTHERRPLLHSQPPTGSSDMQLGCSGSDCASAAASELWLSRRRQLAATLLRETRGGSRPLGVLPVHALPRALTHQLLSRGERRSPGGGVSCTASELELSSRDVASSCRGWGLDTASLQLPEEQLEVGWAGGVHEARGWDAAISRRWPASHTLVWRPSLPCSHQPDSLPFPALLRL
jgi:hypothetical protein